MWRIFAGLLMVGLTVLAIKLMLLFMMFVALMAKPKETLCLLLGLGFLTLLDKHPVPVLIGCALLFGAAIMIGAKQTRTSP